MTKRPKQDLKAFCTGLIGRARNGPRALFKTIEPNGQVLWKDVPENGQAFKIMIKEIPDMFYGVFTTQCRVEDLLKEMEE